jgi:hypothetical protein
MSKKNQIVFLWIATAVIVVAYLFWKVIFWLSGGDLTTYNETGDTSTGVDVFFQLQALFMLMLCWYIHYQKHYTITFILFWLCLGNFIDELLFDNTATSALEIFYAVAVFVRGYLYNEKKIEILRENRK